ncbi:MULTISPECIES: AraC family transcriptional regulator [Acinetobacter]|uniref:AraC family transcriptional regulator n=1 Tax=Acinetobacter TaxID=469 RepID=UPI00064783A9|nr:MULTISPECIES: helix-turn-helix transcriptional regulator [Acinetobacter]OEC90700.1 AraC family transcriptional regulator [Acinetobacter sp. YK3]
MAKISPTTSFNADHFYLPVVGIAADMPVHDSGQHSHRRHQLLFSAAGCITIEMETKVYLLPPGRAAWIPAGVLHRAIMRGVIAYRSLYFSMDLPLKQIPLQIFAVNPLLFEVIERMAFWPWDMSAESQTSLLTVFMEELNTAPKENWGLLFPQDRRLSVWIERIRQGELPLRLNIFAQQAGACERTISRIFIKETGMNYQDWRQQWRILKAIERLAENESISEIAQALEFSSDSAFIAFFRQHTGVTPTCYTS